MIAPTMPGAVPMGDGADDMPPPAPSLQPAPPPPTNLAPPMPGPMGGPPQANPPAGFNPPGTDAKWVVQEQGDGTGLLLPTMPDGTLGPAVKIIKLPKNPQAPIPPAAAGMPSGAIPQ